MTLKKADQFIVDPIKDPKEEVLVEAGWLQAQLRELNTLKTTTSNLTKTHTAMQKEISALKHSLMVARSSQPYTKIIDTRV